MAGMSVPGNSCSGSGMGGNLPTQTCPIRLTGICVYYGGSNIVASGIKTGDTLDVLVNKLSNLSVENLDGSITVTTAPAIVSLNVAHANHWTGVQTFSPTVTAASGIAQGTMFTPTLIAAANNDVLVGNDVTPTFTPGAFSGVIPIAERFTLNNLGTNQVDALYLRNTTPAVGGLQQYSPSITQEAQGFSTGTNLSQQILFTSYIVVNAGNPSPVGTWVLQSDVNAAGAAAVIEVDSNAITARFSNAGLQIPGGGISFSGLPPANSVFRVSNPYTFQNTNTVSNPNSTVWSFTHGGAAPVSNDTIDFAIGSTFDPTSGNATYTTLFIGETIDQTGGANGITRGVHFNPTLTSAADYRAIEVTLGRSIVQALGVGGSDPGITPTTNLMIGASSTAHSHLNLVAGGTPSSPNNGDIWFDGTNLKMRIGGTTKTFTLT